MTAGLPKLDRHPDDGVAVLWLDNPPLNLLTASARAALIDMCSELSEDTTVRTVVLQGAGRCFSAGSDIQEFPADIANRQRRAQLEHRCANAVEQLPQPVIAAVHGHVLGGGLELALASDLRIASDTSVFGFPEIKLGVFPSGGGTYRTRREIGPARTKELMLLGETIDATRARHLGLVNRLVPADQLLADSYQLACEIATRPRLASAAVKQAVRATDETAEATEENLIAELFTSHDAQEGVAAFLGKRTARFEHR